MQNIIKINSNRRKKTRQHLHAWLGLPKQKYVLSRCLKDTAKMPSAATLNDQLIRNVEWGT